MTPFLVEDFSTALGKILKVTPLYSRSLCNKYNLTLGAGIDSNLSDNFGRTTVNGISVITTFITLSIVGGPQFFLVILVIGLLYWNSKYFFSPQCRKGPEVISLIVSKVGCKKRGHIVYNSFTHRFMAKPLGTCDDWVGLSVSKPLCNMGLIKTPSDSVTRSPLYSIYGETISGVTIIRAFGASSKFLRDMLKCVDTVGTSATVP